MPTPGPPGLRPPGVGRSARAASAAPVGRWTSSRRWRRPWPTRSPGPSRRSWRSPGEGGDGDETTAVRGRNPAPPADPRIGTPARPRRRRVVSFDYGSGVVIGDEGEILTAFHVVKGAEPLVRPRRRPAGVRGRDHRRRPAERPGRDRPPRGARRRRRRSSGRSPSATPRKLRKGSFLVALGNPFNAARDGRPSASWGILANVARRLEPSPTRTTQPRSCQLRNYPTLLQLDAKLNLGMSGGAVINLKGELVGLTTAAANAAGFDAQAGYAIPMDALGRRIVEALKQGKEYEYGFLGIGLDTRRARTGSTAPSPGTPAAEGGRPGRRRRSSPSATSPSTDADSLVLAINSMPAGDAGQAQDPPPRTRSIERTVELAKFRVDGEVIATNRPPPWRGLRVDYTSTLPDDHVRPRHARGDGPRRRGRHRGRARLAPPTRPASSAARSSRRVDGQPVRNPRDFAQAVAGLNGPGHARDRPGRRSPSSDDRADSG